MKSLLRGPYGGGTAVSGRFFRARGVPQKRPLQGLRRRRLQRAVLIGIFVGASGGAGAAMVIFPVTASEVMAIFAAICRTDGSFRAVPPRDN